MAVALRRRRPRGCAVLAGLAGIPGWTRSSAVRPWIRMTRPTGNRRPGITVIDPLWGAVPTCSTRPHPDGTSSYSRPPSPHDIQPTVSPRNRGGSPCPTTFSASTSSHGTSWTGHRPICTPPIQRPRGHRRNESWTTCGDRLRGRDARWRRHPLREHGRAWRVVGRGPKSIYRRLPLPIGPNSWVMSGRSSCFSD